VRLSPLRIIKIPAIDSIHHESCHVATWKEQPAPGYCAQFLVLQKTQDFAVFCDFSTGPKVVAGVPHPSPSRAALSYVL
jgi:hypothetical protein